ncbi:hypothetical protein KR222_006096 [Zaprionus bogoriensis]|nr:hypothetical protein KR222_006096 [Zaprionus bogoriensis]
MESINFDDFSEKERHEIITAFLIKMRSVNSMQSAHSFFEYYLKEFYKMPADLLDDIIYCQRAMKSHLAVHEVQSLLQDAEAKKNHLLELEDILHEINAECQYLVLRLEQDIEQFCMPFTEQQLQPNGNLISEMVSEALVPLICGSLSPRSQPHFVHERPTEGQLMHKYFAAPAKAAPALAASDAQPSEVVNASRLHLQAALQRARQNRSQTANSENKACSPKEQFLQFFGLCTHSQHKSMLQSRAQARPQKRVVKSTRK